MSARNKQDSRDTYGLIGHICELGIVPQATPGSGESPQAVNGSGYLKLDSFGRMLDRIGIGYIILDEHKKIVGWNPVARAALNIHGERKELAKEISCAFKQLVMNVHCQLSPGTLCWIVIPHVSGMPVVVHEECDFTPNDKCVVFLLTRDTKPRPNGIRLQKLFGLTGAETDVALNIACGYTLLEIAHSRNLSRTTIRSHLAALFLKTETRRQSELIALLSSMSVLP